MNPEKPYPRADGKSYVVDLVAGECREADGPAYLDFQHTDRLDNYTAMEVILRGRCHAMHLEGLAYPITPMGMHYLLIHYDIPELDEATYQVRVDGLVKNKLSLDMTNIRKRPRVTMPATMECCGNGRMNQRHRLWLHVPWNNDAIGTSEWTGTPLRGVLEEAGLDESAVEILFTGKDKGIQGQQVQYFQRSLSIDQAMNGDCLLAYEINGQPLPPQHGFPLRLIVPGWLGMTNVKWIDSIEATSTRLTERQMKWYSYAANDEDPNRIPATFQQVRSLMIPPGIPDFFTRFHYLEETSAVKLRGRAWAGGIPISTVEVSTDGGSNWAPATLDAPIGKWAWVGWSFTWENVIAKGNAPAKYTLRVRATDADGNVQKNDDPAHDYYAMDVIKPQYVDVVVLPKGSLAPFAHVNVPVQYPTF